MSDIKGLREITDDPFGRLLTLLSKKFSAFLAKDQAESVENPEDIFSMGQDVESSLKYHNFTMSKKFDLKKVYYSTAEPDYDKLKVWVIGRSQGNTLRDYSGFENTITLFGDPILIDGTPLDWGLSDSNTKSIALRLNRSTSTLVNREHITITDNSNLQVTGITIGLSYFFRIKFNGDTLTTQENSIKRTLLQKIDDPSLNNGVHIFIDYQNQRVVFFLKLGGTITKKETPTATLVAGTVYDICCTFTVSGSVMHIYINNVDKTLTTSGYGEFWANTADHDMYLMKRGGTTDGGHVEADLYDFRIYKEDILKSDSHGSGVFFDGVDDYIDLTNDAALWSSTLSKFSFSFWIYPTVMGDANDRRLVQHNVAANNGFGCYIDGTTSGRINFRIKNNAGTTRTAFSNSLTLNAWNHIICSYDNSLGSANVKIYVNGVLGSTTANETGTINLSTTLRLSDTPTHFQGYMRDFRWWTTEGKSTTDATNLFNDSYPRSYNYQLRLTEGIGTPTDTITGTKTGAFSGAVWIIDDVGNLYTNKWTTAYIPFGQVSFSNYACSSP